MTIYHAAAAVALCFTLSGCNATNTAGPPAGAMAAGKMESRQALVGTWSGSLASGKSIQLRIPESGTPSYRFDGQNVAVRSASMTGGALVMAVGRGPGTVTVTPSGNGLAYTYRDGGGTARTMLSRS